MQLPSLPSLGCNSPQGPGLLLQLQPSQPCSQQRVGGSTKYHPPLLLLLLLFLLLRNFLETLHDILLISYWSYFSPMVTSQNRDWEVWAAVWSAGNQGVHIERRRKNGYVVKQYLWCATFAFKLTDSTYVYFSLLKTEHYIGSELVLMCLVGAGIDQK